MPRHVIEDFDQPDPNEPIEVDTPDEDDDGVAVSGSVEIPGLKIDDVDDFIVDPFTGKKWAVPTGKLEDNLVYSSPYDIRNKNPDFHYSAYRIDEVGDMEAQGFVKVTRKETGVERTVLSSDTPLPLDSYHTIGGGDQMQVIMKIPKVLADRRYAAQKALCDAAVQVTQVRPSLNGAVQGDGQDHSVAHNLIAAKKAFDKDGSRIA